MRTRLFDALQKPVDIEGVEQPLPRLVDFERVIRGNELVDRVDCTDRRVLDDDVATNRDEIRVVRQLVGNMIFPGSAISLLNSRDLPTCYFAGVAETQL
jgi:hypothetical protein